MVDQRASAVKFLKAVVNNENTATSARVRAIELLGVLGTAESAAVLLDNLSFRRAIWMKTDEDMLKEFPCTLALIKMGWAVIPEVFEFVKSPRQDLEIFQLFVLLHKMPGGSTARRLLEEELEVATEDIHKENLERLLDSIK
jgi:hypothetical protein